MRSQENPDIFCEIGPVTASLQWPRHCYGARMAFYRAPVIVGVSLRSNNAVTVLSRRSQCMHCAFMAFTLR